MKIEVLDRTHQKLLNDILFIFISSFSMELLAIENWWYGRGGCGSNVVFYVPYGVECHIKNHFSGMTGHSWTHGEIPRLKRLYDPNFPRFSALFQEWPVIPEKYNGQTSENVVACSACE